MKLFTTAGIALLIGIATGWGIWGRNQDEKSANYHWEKVLEYRDFIENPENYERQGKFSVASGVPDVTANLAALVSMSELHRREVIIPGLPNEREHILSWMKFCKRPGIIEAVGPGNHQDGEIPLMFTVWYTDEAEAALNKFVEELQAKATRQENTEGEQAEALKP